MARVLKKKISWDASDSADVVAYRVYVAAEGDTLNYQSLSAEVAAPKTEIEIPDEFTGFPQVEAVYQIGVSAVDDVGNESDMVKATFPFDFDAPSAPSNLVIADL